MAKKKKTITAQIPSTGEEVLVEKDAITTEPLSEEQVMDAPSPERPIDEALSDIVAKQTDELRNELVPVTEIKPLPEEVLASLYDKHGIPRDFNASHPRWNVPSMKNRYALLLADIADHEKL